MRRFINGILVTARTRQSQSPALGSSVKTHTPSGSESRRTIHHSSRRRSTPRRAWRIVHMRSRYTEVPRPPTKHPPRPGWRRPVHGCLALLARAARLDAGGGCGTGNDIANSRNGLGIACGFKRWRTQNPSWFSLLNLIATESLLTIPLKSDAIYTDRVRFMLLGGFHVVGMFGEFPQELAHATPLSITQTSFPVGRYVRYAAGYSHRNNW